MLCASSPILHETSVFYGNSITDYRLHTSSSCAGPSLSKKKIRRANDESSSFCHTIYLTIKKRLASPLDDDDDDHPRRVPDRDSSTPTTPTSSTCNSLQTSTISDLNPSLVKSTNFTSPLSVSRAEIRHKSEIEIEVKTNGSPSSTPFIRPTGLTNKRTPTLSYDDTLTSTQYHTAKRRPPANSIPTQTPSDPSDQQQQQLKALTDETLSKTEKIQAILRELTDCQAIIKQQEQQLSNGKKDRDQLCFIVDERTNELRNLKLKNEQLEQMIRNEHEHSTDEKKLLGLLQDSQDERDELLNQQRQTYERLQKLEEQVKYYENDAAKMRDHILCSKIKFETKSDENERLTNEFVDMKAKCDRLEQENQKLKAQIEQQGKKIEECAKSKGLVDLELQASLEKLRSQRYEHEGKLASLDDALKYSQKQCQMLQHNHRSAEDKHEKERREFREQIHQLETKIEEVIKEKALTSIRCGELYEENRKLEKVLNDKEDDYEEKIHAYRDKNSSLSVQLEEIEKKWVDTKKQLEFMTIEKDETLADMLIAVRVASEMRHDAEDRLNKATDDLRRVTEHIEQERAITKEVQRRQLQLPSVNRNSTGFCGRKNDPCDTRLSLASSDFGQIKIKEMIRTLEANSRNNASQGLQHHPADASVRQRPLSQPCARTGTNSLLINSHARQWDTSPMSDDARFVSSAKMKSSSPLNNSHRSDQSMRSITNEQYDEMKSIVEAVFTRMPGSVCKRDALLKWCVERLATYGISMTNFSNSWTDGIAFCSLLHSYLPDRIDLEMIKLESKKKRFEIAFDVASSVGIVSILDVEEMCSSEWPDWERVMYYVALIFRHFEGLASDPSMSPILPLPQASSSPLSSSSTNSSPAYNTSTSSSLCGSLRSSNSIPTTLCSALQTV